MNETTRGLASIVLTIMLIISSFPVAFAQNPSTGSTGSQPAQPSAQPVKDCASTFCPDQPLAYKGVIDKISVTADQIKSMKLSDIQALAKSNPKIIAQLGMYQGRPNTQQLVEVMKIMEGDPTLVKQVTAEQIQHLATTSPETLSKLPQEMKKLMTVDQLGNAAVLNAIAGEKPGLSGLDPAAANAALKKIFPNLANTDVNLIGSTDIVFLTTPDGKAYLCNAAFNDCSKGATPPQGLEMTGLNKVRLLQPVGKDVVGNFEGKEQGFVILREGHPPIYIFGNEVFNSMAMDANGNINYCSGTICSSLFKGTVHEIKELTDQGVVSITHLQNGKIEANIGTDKVIIEGAGSIDIYRRKTLEGDAIDVKSTAENANKPILVTHRDNQFKIFDGTLSIAQTATGFSYSGKDYVDAVVKGSGEHPTDDRFHSTKENSWSFVTQIKNNAQEMTDFTLTGTGANAIIAGYKLITGAADKENRPIAVTYHLQTGNGRELLDAKANALAAVRAAKEGLQAVQNRLEEDLKNGKKSKVTVPERAADGTITSKSYDCSAQGDTINCGGMTLQQLFNTKLDKKTLNGLEQDLTSKPEIFLSRFYHPERGWLNGDIAGSGPSHILTADGLKVDSVSKGANFAYRSTPPDSKEKTRDPTRYFLVGSSAADDQDYLTFNQQFDIQDKNGRQVLGVTVNGKPALIFLKDGIYYDSSGKQLDPNNAQDKSMITNAKALSTTETFSKTTENGVEKNTARMRTDDIVLQSVLNDKTGLLASDYTFSRDLAKAMDNSIKVFHGDGKVLRITGENVLLFGAGQSGKLGDFYKTQYTNGEANVNVLKDLEKGWSKGERVAKELSDELTAYYMGKLTEHQKTEYTQQAYDEIKAKLNREPTKDELQKAFGVVVYTKAKEQTAAQLGNIETPSIYGRVLTQGQTTGFLGEDFLKMIKDPADARVSLYNALTARAEGKYADAVNAFNEYASKGGDSKRALQGVVSTYIEAKDFKAAKAALPKSDQPVYSLIEASIDAAEAQNTLDSKTRADMYQNIASKLKVQSDTDPDFLRARAQYLVEAASAIANDPKRNEQAYKDALAVAISSATSATLSDQDKNDLMLRLGATADEMKAQNPDVWAKLSDDAKLEMTLRDIQRKSNDLAQQAFILSRSTNPADQARAKEMLENAGQGLRDFIAKQQGRQTPTDIYETLAQIYLAQGNTGAAAEAAAKAQAANRDQAVAKDFDPLKGFDYYSFALKNYDLASLGLRIDEAKTSTAINQFNAATKQLATAKNTQEASNAKAAIDAAQREINTASNDLITRAKTALPFIFDASAGKQNQNTMLGQIKDAYVRIGDLANAATAASSITKNVENVRNTPAWNALKTEERQHLLDQNIGALQTMLQDAAARQDATNTKGILTIITYDTLAAITELDSTKPKDDNEKKAIDQRKNDIKASLDRSYEQAFNTLNTYSEKKEIADLAKGNAGQQAVNNLYASLVMQVLSDKDDEHKTALLVLAKEFDNTGDTKAMENAVDSLIRDNYKSAYTKEQLDEIVQNTIKSLQLSTTMANAYAQRGNAIDSTKSAATASDQAVTNAMTNAEIAKIDLQKYDKAVAAKAELAAMRIDLSRINDPEYLKANPKLNEDITRAKQLQKDAAYIDSDVVKKNGDLIKSLQNSRETNYQANTQYNNMIAWGLADHEFTQRLNENQQWTDVYARAKANTLTENDKSFLTRQGVKPESIDLLEQISDLRSLSIDNVALAGRKDKMAEAQYNQVEATRIGLGRPSTTATELDRLLKIRAGQQDLLKSAKYAIQTGNEAIDTRIKTLQDRLSRTTDANEKIFLSERIDKLKADSGQFTDYQKTLEQQITNQENIVKATTTALADIQGRKGSDNLDIRAQEERIRLLSGLSLAERGKLGQNANVPDLIKTAVNDLDTVKTENKRAIVSSFSALMIDTDSRLKTWVDQAPSMSTKDYVDKQAENSKDMQLMALRAKIIMNGDPSLALAFAQDQAYNQRKYGTALKSDYDNQHTQEWVATVRNAADQVLETDFKKAANMESYRAIKNGATGELLESQMAQFVQKHPSFSMQSQNMAGTNLQDYAFNRAQVEIKQQLETSIDENIAKGMRDLMDKGTRYDDAAKAMTKALQNDNDVKSLNELTGKRMATARSGQDLMNAYLSDGTTTTRDSDFAFVQQSKILAEIKTGMDRLQTQQKTMPQENYVNSVAAYKKQLDSIIGNRNTNDIMALNAGAAATDLEGNYARYLVEHRLEGSYLSKSNRLVTQAVNGNFNEYTDSSLATAKTNVARGLVMSLVAAQGINNLDEGLKQNAIKQGVITEDKKAGTLSINREYIKNAAVHVDANIEYGLKENWMDTYLGDQTLVLSLATMGLGTSVMGGAKAVQAINWLSTGVRAGARPAVQFLARTAIFEGVNQAAQYGGGLAINTMDMAYNGKITNAQSWKDNLGITTLSERGVLGTSIAAANAYSTSLAFFGAGSISHSAAASFGNGVRSFVQGSLNSGQTIGKLAEFVGKEAITQTAMLVPAVVPEVTSAWLKGEKIDIESIAGHALVGGVTFAIGTRGMEAAAARTTGRILGRTVPEITQRASQERATALQDATFATQAVERRLAEPQKIAYEAKVKDALEPLTAQRDAAIKKLGSLTAGTKNQAESEINAQYAAAETKARANVLAEVVGEGKTQKTINAALDKVQGNDNLISAVQRMNEAAAERAKATGVLTPEEVKAGMKSPGLDATAFKLANLKHTQAAIEVVDQQRRLGMITTGTAESMVRSIAETGGVIDRAVSEVIPKAQNAIHAAQFIETNKATLLPEAAKTIREKAASDLTAALGSFSESMANAEGGALSRTKTYYEALGKLAKEVERQQKEGINDQSKIAPLVQELQRQQAAASATPLDAESAADAQQVANAVVASIKNNGDVNLEPYARAETAAQILQDATTKARSETAKPATAELIRFTGDPEFVKAQQEYQEQQSNTPPTDLKIKTMTTEQVQKYELYKRAMVEQELNNRFAQVLAGGKPFRDAGVNAEVARRLAAGETLPAELMNELRLEISRDSAEVKKAAFDYVQSAGQAQVATVASIVGENLAAQAIVRSNLAESAKAVEAAAQPAAVPAAPATPAVAQPAVRPTPVEVTPAPPKIVPLFGEPRSGEALRIAAREMTEGSALEVRRQGKDAQQAEFISVDATGINVRLRNTDGSYLRNADGSVITEKIMFDDTTAQVRREAPAQAEALSLPAKPFTEQTRNEQSIVSESGRAVTIKVDEAVSSVFDYANKLGINVQIAGGNAEKALRGAKPTAGEGRDLDIGIPSEAALAVVKLQDAPLTESAKQMLAEQARLGRNLGPQQEKLLANMQMILDAGGSGVRLDVVAVDGKYSPDIAFIQGLSRTRNLIGSDGRISTPDSFVSDAQQNRFVIPETNLPQRHEFPLRFVRSVTTIEGYKPVEADYKAAMDAIKGNKDLDRIGSTFPTDRAVTVKQLLKLATDTLHPEIADRMMTEMGLYKYLDKSGFDPKGPSIQRNLELNLKEIFAGDNLVKLRERFTENGKVDNDRLSTALQGVMEGKLTLSEALNNKIPTSQEYANMVGQSTTNGKVDESVLAQTFIEATKAGAPAAPQAAPIETGKPVAPAQQAPVAPETTNKVTPTAEEAANLRQYLPPRTSITDITVLPTGETIVQLEQSSLLGSRTSKTLTLDTNRVYTLENGRTLSVVDGKLQLNDAVVKPTSTVEGGIFGSKMQESMHIKDSKGTITTPVTVSLRTTDQGTLLVKTTQPRGILPRIFSLGLLGKSIETQRTMAVGDVMRLSDGKVLRVEKVNIKDENGEIIGQSTQAQIMPFYPRYLTKLGIPTDIAITAATVTATGMLTPLAFLNLVPLKRIYTGINQLVKYTPSDWVELSSLRSSDRGNKVGTPIDLTKARAAAEAIAKPVAEKPAITPPESVTPAPVVKVPEPVVKPEAPATAKPAPVEAKPVVPEPIAQPEAQPRPQPVVTPAAPTTKVRTTIDTVNKELANQIRLPAGEGVKSITMFESAVDTVAKVDIAREGGTDTYYLVSGLGYTRRIANTDITMRYEGDNLYFERDATSFGSTRLAQLFGKQNTRLAIIDRETIQTAQDIAQQSPKPAAQTPAPAVKLPVAQNEIIARDLDQEYTLQNVVNMIESKGIMGHIIYSNLAPEIRAQVQSQLSAGAKKTLDAYLFIYEQKAFSDAVKNNPEVNQKITDRKNSDKLEKQRLEVLDIGADKNLWAQGTEIEKGGLSNIIRIMIEGEIIQGQFGQLANGDTTTTAGPHGPFYIVVDTNPVKGNPSDIANHKAYVVPEAIDRIALREMLNKAQTAGLIDKPNADSISRRIVTYDEFITGQGDIPKTIELAESKAQKPAAPESVVPAVKVPLTAKDRLAQSLDSGLKQGKRFDSVAVDLDGIVWIKTYEGKIEGFGDMYGFQRLERMNIVQEGPVKTKTVLGDERIIGNNKIVRIVETDGQNRVVADRIEVTPREGGEKTIVEVKELPIGNIFGGPAAQPAVAEPPVQIVAGPAVETARKITIAGKTVILRPGERLVIGRDKALETENPNNFIIGDMTVSGRHAEVFIENGVVMIQDIGSKNGVRVNGQNIGFKAAPLTTDTQIGFAKNVVISLGAEISAPAAKPKGGVVIRVNDGKQLSLNEGEKIILGRRSEAGDPKRLQIANEGQLKISRDQLEIVFQNGLVKIKNVGTNSIEVGSQNIQPTKEVNLKPSQLQGLKIGSKEFISAEYGNKGAYLGSLEVIERAVGKESVESTAETNKEASEVIPKVLSAVNTIELPKLPVRGLQDPAIAAEVKISVQSTRTAGDPVLDPATRREIGINTITGRPIYEVVIIRENIDAFTTMITDRVAANPAQKAQLEKMILTHELSEAAALNHGFSPTRAHEIGLLAEADFISTIPPTDRTVLREAWRVRQELERATNPELYENSPNTPQDVIAAAQRQAFPAGIEKTVVENTAATREFVSGNAYERAVLAATEIITRQRIAEWVNNPLTAPDALHATTALRGEQQKAAIRNIVNELRITTREEVLQGKQGILQELQTRIESTDYTAQDHTKSALLTEQVQMRLETIMGEETRTPTVFIRETLVPAAKETEEINIVIGGQRKTLTLNDAVKRLEKLRGEPELVEADIMVEALTRHIETFSTTQDSAVQTSVEIAKRAVSDFANSLVTEATKKDPATLPGGRITYEELAQAKSMEASRLEDLPADVQAVAKAIGVKDVGLWLQQLQTFGGDTVSARTFKDVNGQDTISFEFSDQKNHGTEAAALRAYTSRMRRYALQDLALKLEAQKRTTVENTLGKPITSATYAELEIALSPVMGRNELLKQMATIVSKANMKSLPGHFMSGVVLDVNSQSATAHMFGYDISTISRVNGKLLFNPSAAKGGTVVGVVGNVKSVELPTNGLEAVVLRNDGIAESTDLTRTKMFKTMDLRTPAEVQKTLQSEIQIKISELNALTEKAMQPGSPEIVELARKVRARMERAGASQSDIAKINDFIQRQLPEKLKSFDARLQEVLDKGAVPSAKEMIELGKKVSNDYTEVEAMREQFNKIVTEEAYLPKKANNILTKSWESTKAAVDSAIRWIDNTFIGSAARRQSAELLSEYKTIEDGSIKRIYNDDMSLAFVRLERPGNAQPPAAAQESTIAEQAQKASLSASKSKASPKDADLTRDVTTRSTEPIVKITEALRDIEAAKLACRT
jgi:pSer/pThr/pTyr-binding forkhead associated (FHA) protein